MTDEETPTPMPASSASGWRKALVTCQPPIGVQAVDSADSGVLRDAVCEHDVEREQAGVGERKGEAERL